MFETIAVLTYVFIANIPLAKFSWLYYITLYNAKARRTRKQLAELTASRGS